MNDLTPYERFLAGNLQNIPLPDEDMAWKEMEKLLEEKDDDRPLVAAWFKGCLPWLIGALLLGSGVLVWYIWKNSSQHETRDAEQKQRSNQIQQKAVDTSSRSSITVSEDAAGDQLNDSAHHRTPSHIDQPVNSAPKSRESHAESTVIASTDRSTSNGTSGTAKIQSRSSGVANISTNDSREIKAGAKRSTSRTRSVAGKMSAKVSRPASTEDQQKTNPGDNSSTRKEKARNSGIEKDVPKLEMNREEAGKNDTISELIEIVPGIENSIIEDSVKTRVQDTAKAMKPASRDSLPVSDSTKKSPGKKRTSFTFAAGLAVNQSIPLNGEKPVPYDYFGRKSSLGDYIPSVYFRAMKPRWFIQSEFRYGAPNSVKEFVYSKKTTIDTFQNISTSSKTLKKTFYHQIPLTFHYFITKNWSVGVGIAYNKFTRAVRQEDVRVGIAGTIRDSLISSNIVQDGKDSAFVSHSFQWIAETQYRWKRFSLGLRFAQGLQPYIKYTDPESGLPAEKRNQSLNAFLRYDLWRSKKK